MKTHYIYFHEYLTYLRDEMRHIRWWWDNDRMSKPSTHSIPSISTAYPKHNSHSTKLS